MAVFEYKALDSNGKKNNGIITAQSELSAKNKLRKKNLFPFELSKLESKPIGKEKKDKTSFLNWDLFSKISSAELSMITRQLSTLLSAGFPLVKAIASIILQTKSNAMRKTLSNVKNAIEEGSSFANALALFPHAFSPVFINMVNAGESSGTLEIVLERLADFIEDKEDSRKKIQASLAYPILMAFIGFIVLIILLTYVVPGIVTLFADMDHALPLPTIILISISSFFKKYWWIMGISFLAFVFLIRFIKRYKKGAYLIDKFLIKLPLIGNLLIKIIATRFTRTLGSLLENGVPMLTALNITKSIVGNIVMQELIDKAYKAVEQGKELSEILEQSHYFPYLAMQMIKIGETSGQMEKMLEKTADLFEKDVQNTITAAMSLIEPLIILTMGVIVGLIILAICLPVFEINQLIR